MSDDHTDARAAWARINTTIPHSARLWDFLLGGKDNFAADREAATKMMALFPDYAEVARLQRQFLIRAVSYLAGEAGIRQFLDIGTGLPTANNTHEVAQRIAPDSRVVYVDNDPIVLVHARALLTSTEQGATTYLDADFRQPDVILQGAEEILDFTRPVAVMMLGIAGQVTDEEDPKGLIDAILDPLPSGSYLAFTDGTNVHPPLVEALRIYNQNANNTYQLRSPEQFASFFDGLDLIDPGLVPTAEWRPEPDRRDKPVSVTVSLAGVACKP
ncbi:SAM-dependent methyltransferase [Nonomuraea sp. NBC_00507]|uniref:SAM-dependent methyltransferase n=1 Tax=Nonomuraea sp. NBC_00507 TaxID=2976002 RepID=UPI002E18EE59